MGTSNSLSPAIEDFFAAIAPARAAYQRSTFSYLAIRELDGFEIVRAHLVFNLSTYKGPAGHFSSANVRAGIYPISELAADEKELVRALESGVIETPEGRLLFSHPESQLAISFVPSHQDGASDQTRLAVATILGRKIRPLLRDSELDWELRSAQQPFDGVRDILLEYGLGALGDNARVDLAAHAIAMIERNSAVRGNHASPIMLLAPGLDESGATLAYRVVHENHVLSRGILAGSAIKWTKEPTGVMRGLGEIEVSPGAAVHCIAIYGGVAYHHYWIVDPSVAHNASRAVVQTFDRDIATLRETCLNPQRGSRDFESAIASLMWLLGFSTANLRIISDAPDILAMTPAGHYVIVECTTGVPRTDNKLSKLAARADEARRQLKSSGFEYRRVVPVLVTSLALSQVAGDVEEAKTRRILLLTREDIDEALKSTLLLQSADDWFMHAEETIRNYHNP